MIEPGDTIRVIGEFDKKGNCDVNHDNNLLIIHPNLLLSGTRVIVTSLCFESMLFFGSFICENSTLASI